MYTNMGTGATLYRVGQFACANEKQLPVSHEALMDALTLLMRNNVFQFGDTFWLQKVGTAMGAPPAPPGQ